MKNRILCLALEYEIAMRHKAIMLSSMLLLFGLILCSNLAKSHNEPQPQSFFIPVQIKATEHVLREIEEICLNIQMDNLPQVMSIKMNDLAQKDKQNSDVKFTYKSDGKIDVDIIIRVVGSLSAHYPLSDIQEPRKLILGNIEVITVDNISGVTQSEPNIIAFRASINGINVTQNNQGQPQAAPIISLLPPIYKGQASKVKPGKSDLFNFAVVFPNPSTDGNIRIKTNLEGLNIEQIQVFNSLGSMMMQQDLRSASAQEMALQLNLLKGIYYVRILTPLGETTQKLIVSR